MRAAAGCAAPGSRRATRGRRSRPRGALRPAAVDGRGVQGVGDLHVPGAGVRLWRRASRLGDHLDQRRQGEADVGDDRVAHRGPHRLVGVGGDRDQAGALGQQRSRNVGVVGEDRAADDDDQVVALQGLADRADRGRQDAAEVRMVLREAEAHAPGRGRGPDREALALGEGDRAVPAAGRVDVQGRRQDRVRGPRRAGPAASAATAAGSATARPLTLRVVAWRASSASTSTPSRPSAG